ncbi:acyltransferase family protein [Novosphingobium ovatum]|nr:acyltransferase [Novosphingobium ovatum]
MCDFVCRLLWPAGPGAFRLWLALMVVVHHLTGVEIGKAPVLVFFALSGFWVTRVWEGRYRHLPQAWRNFVISRWWRLAPLLVLASVGCIGAQLWVGDSDWALVRTTPWAQGIAPFTVLGYGQLPTRPVGPAWSLDVEMQFYVALPVLAWVVRRWSGWAVGVVGYAVFVAALLGGWGTVLPSFLPFFLIGMLAARHQWAPPRWLAWGGFGAVVGYLAVAAVWAPAGIWIAHAGPSAPLANLVLGVALIPFGLWTVHRPSDARDGWCADQSYIVYVLHWPVITLIYKGGWESPLEMAALLVVLGAFCAAVWRWYDRPIERKRRAWLAGRMAQELDSGGAVATKV